MSVLDRLWLVLWNLGEITLACIPLFIVLLGIEKLGDKMAETNLIGKIYEWADKLAGVNRS